MPTRKRKTALDHKAERAFERALVRFAAVLDAANPDERDEQMETLGERPISEDGLDAL